MLPRKRIINIIVSFLFARINDREHTHTYCRRVFKMNETCYGFVAVAFTLSYMACIWLLIHSEFSKQQSWTDRHRSQILPSLWQFYQHHCGWVFFFFSFVLFAIIGASMSARIEKFKAKKKMKQNRRRALLTHCSLSYSFSSSLVFLRFFFSFILFLLHACSAFVLTCYNAFALCVYHICLLHLNEDKREL